mmetsp:Transcript_9079/g.19295  ORF Transcript_9079/g.19295 Transcript_9079/m.19295 type:complete len:200 (-) Transcript_9079:717-1316(-)
MMMLLLLLLLLLWPRPEVVHELSRHGFGIPPKIIARTNIAATVTASITTHGVRTAIPTAAVIAHDVAVGAAVVHRHHHPIPPIQITSATIAHSTTTCTSIPPSMMILLLMLLLLLLRLMMVHRPSHHRSLPIAHPAIRRRTTRIISIRISIPWHQSTGLAKFLPQNPLHTLARSRWEYWRLSSTTAEAQTTTTTAICIG